MEEEALRRLRWRCRKQNGGLIGNSGGAEMELREAVSPASISGSREDGDAPVWNPGVLAWFLLISYLD